MEEDQYCDFMDFLDEEYMAAFLGEDSQNTASPTGNTPKSLMTPITSSTTNLCPPSSCMQPIQPNKEFCVPNFDPISSSPIILDFGNGNSHESPEHERNVRILKPDDEKKAAGSGNSRNPQEGTKVEQTTKKRSRVRPPSQTYDHIIAERKRREQLSQLFLALSAIVPGLKKMDKTTVLGDAIEYMKKLQHRVKILEEQATKQTLESVILVKRSQVLVQEEGSCHENRYDDEQALPEIEVRMCKNQLLLRIHCEKHFLSKIMGEVENLDLSIVNASVSQFGNLAIHITIAAEMEKKSNMNLKEIVQSLGSALNCAATA